MGAARQTSRNMAACQKKMEFAKAIKMKEKIKNIISKEHTNVLGIAEYKKNQKVYEEYFCKSNENESIHNFSITKSAISLLVGIAIDKGYIDSVHLYLLLLQIVISITYALVYRPNQRMDLINHCLVPYIDYLEK